MTARPQPSIEETDTRSSDSAVAEGTQRDLEFTAVSEGHCSAPLAREITDFLDTQDTSHPFQLPRWSGGGAEFFLLRSQGRIQWFAKSGVLYPAGRVLRPIRALILNRAPVSGNAELMQFGLDRLVKEALNLGIAYIDILPEWTGAFAECARLLLARNGWLPLCGARATLRLDLTPALERLMASFRSGTRYDIRRSEAAGITVTMAQSDADFREFLRLYADMARQKQFPAEAPDFLLGVFRWLATNQNRGGLFLARDAGSLRGGILLIRTGTRCWYILGATAKDNKLSAGHLLQWRGIAWAKQVGCREYDFGGYLEESNSGPAFFKRGFCDRVVRFLPPHRYVISEPRYNLLQIAGKVRRTLRVS